jgi:tRNA pseudouridine38-40 synthase
LRAPEGVRLENVPVASDALPDRTHPSHRLAPDTRRDPASFTDAHRKKPAALLVGYAGGSFRGNTVNHELPRGSTVDDVLEDALFAAGGVKTSNYRSRALARLKWSRSSRTDKGVSSLATVVSLRLELDPAVWDADQGGDYEAKALCAKINAHLPETVRVFGVYSTPKSFQARRACVRRTYDYLLPARCLGISSPGTASSGVASPGMGIPGDVPWPGAPCASAQSPAETLALFRDALSKFEGSHYFHNYTRRAAYSRGKDTDGNGKGRGSRDRTLVSDRASDADSDSDVLDFEAEEARTEETLERGEEDEQISEPVARHVGSRRDGVYWLLERDENDLVGIKHNRRIASFVAGDVETLTLDTHGEVPGSISSEPFVRVTVRGDSFMLYQIRKMVATAVAVALGHYPPELIPASLARPARVVTPIAPPSTLYLRDAEFVPFAKNKRAAAPAAGEKECARENGATEEDSSFGARKNGAANPTSHDSVELATVARRPDRLVPSSETRETIERFRERTLDPALGPALASDEWDAFVANLFLSRVWTKDGKGRHAVARGSRGARGVRAVRRGALGEESEPTGDGRTRGGGGGGGGLKGGWRRTSKIY